MTPNRNATIIILSKVKSMIPWAIQNKKHLKKCRAHSPLRAATLPIHQVSLLSHAATVARRLCIDVHNDDDDDDDNNNNA